MRAAARAALAILVALVAAAGLGAYLLARGWRPAAASQRAAAAGRAPAGAQAPLTLAELEESGLLNESPSLGPAGASKVVVVVYDPECPYCALELNATLPFLYYISAGTGQARVVFLGLPIHEYSVPMLEILDAVYRMYGPGAFARLLGWNYAYYVYWIEQYEEGKVRQLVVPTNATLLQMADELGYNVTQAEAAQYAALVEETASFLVQHGIYATPTLLAYDGQGAPAYVQVGLASPLYLECNVTEALSLSVPGLSCPP